MHALAPLAVAAAFGLAGCTNLKTYKVRSDPPGAEVLLDGQPAGRTPAEILLDTHKGEHLVLLRLRGYVPFEQKVMTKPMLEGPTQNCAAAACSPCCLFVPLALFLEKGFTPKTIDAALEREGQFLEITCRPIGAEVWVDGLLMAQAQPGREEGREGDVPVRYPADWGTASVPLAPGPHRIQIRAEGYTPWEAQLEIRDREDCHLKIDMIAKPR